MTEGVTAAVLEPLAFDSFAMLRRWHSEQLRQMRASGPFSAGVARHYVQCIQASGAAIASEDERLSAQDILDYWSAELISAAPSENQSWSPPRLAEFVPSGDGFEAPGEGGGAASETATARIRLAASARLWRDSGFKKGYLLFGQALSDAKRFRDDDPDITELIRKSEVFNQALVRNRRILRTSAAVALAGAAVIFAILWWQAEGARQNAEKEAETARKAVENANAAWTELDELSRKANRVIVFNSQRYKDAVVANTLNNTLLDLVRREVEQGRLDTSLLPPAVKSAINRLTVAPDAEQGPGGAAWLGYLPDFLGTPLLPMPGHADGKDVLAYPNYSILMHRSRRIAVVAASNVDRQRLRVLPRVGVQPACDPRLPCDRQADPAWFARNFDIGHLVPRNLVAWGPAVDGLELEAASRRLAGFVNRMPNITPQFEPFNLGVWEQAEQWVLTEHNRAAARLVVFTGPVLRDDDPVIAGVQTPRAFWKVVVSSRFERAGGVVVDAFIVPQLKPGTTEKADSTPFQPSRFRTTIAELEQATGLDFGPQLRQVPAPRSQAAPLAPEPGPTRVIGPMPLPHAVPQPVPPSLADRLALVPGRTRGLRPMAMPEAAPQPAPAPPLVASLPSPGVDLPASARQALASAAAALASDDASLSPTDRADLVLLLSKLPAATWDEPDWLDTKALARRVTATFEAQAGVTSEPLSPQTSALIAKLKPSLGWDAAKGRTVYFQFSGMGQPDARAITRGLRAVGWSIPGEEGVEEKRARNGVYYTDPADLPAALLLAADLRALGQQQVGPPQQIKGGKPGNLEAWVSP